MRNRRLPDERPQLILAAGLKLAEDVGYQRLTREALAKAAMVSPGLINFYFGNMTKAREAVMAEAVRTSNVAVVAQGLAAGDPVAAKAPQALRSLAAGRVFDAAV